jgi:tripartite-type tricarboxylate transporter receptor subunit TctC
MGWRPSLGLTFYFYLMICIGDVTGVTHKWINSSTDPRRREADDRKRAYQSFSQHASLTMELPRRKFLHLTISATALAAGLDAALALDYPTRPVHLIVGFPAGFTPDIIARLAAQALSERLGKQIIVDNRPGAASNIGTELVVKALPDGYTLLGATGANAINATLYENLSFNFIRDIAPVASIVRAPLVMTLSRQSRPRSACRSGAAGVCADTDGHKLRALAVTSTTRVLALPDIPTMTEFVPGYEASTWFGIGAPNGVPAEIVAKLNKEVNAGLAHPKMIERLTDLGSDPMQMAPAEFGKYIADETAKWARVIRTSNIKPE